MRRTLFVIALLVGVGVIGAGIWDRMQMKRLGVVIYVTPEVIEKGAVVTIMTRLVPVDEFEARYPVSETSPDVAGAPEAERQWYGTVTGPVDIVYFEIPDDTSYTYRFRAVPENGQAAATVLERVLTIGGTTFDADGNNTGYARFGLNRAHEISGIALSRAWISREGDYAEDEIICTQGGGVRVCSPTEEGLRNRAAYLTRTTPSIEGRTPWED